MWILRPARLGDCKTLHNCRIKLHRQTNWVLYPITITNYNGRPDASGIKPGTPGRYDRPGIHNPEHFPSETRTLHRNTRDPTIPRKLPRFSINHTRSTRISGANQIIERRSRHRWTHQPPPIGRSMNTIYTSYLTINTNNKDKCQRNPKLDVVHPRQHYTTGTLLL